jgi:hypothetical protein
MIHDDDTKVFFMFQFSEERKRLRPRNKAIYGVGGVHVTYCPFRYHDTLFLLCIYLHDLWDM